MKRFIMLALTAGSLALAVPAFAQTTVPRDTGGTPGNGQAATSGERDQGGTPGNGKAKAHK